MALLKKEIQFVFFAAFCFAFPLATQAQNAKPANLQANQSTQIAALSVDSETTLLASTEAGSAGGAKADRPQTGATAPAKKDDTSDKSSAVLSPAELAAKYAKVAAWDFDAIRFPGVENTIVQEGLGIRPALLKYGIGFVFMEIGAFNYNALNPPMYGANGPYKGQNTSAEWSAAKAGTAQAYAGQRPTGYNNSYWYVTKSLGDNTQLEFCVQDVWTTFLPTASTDDVKFCALQVNRYLFKRRVKLMAGYIQDTNEFWGMYTAGNMAGSLLGALAVIPGEAGEATMKNLAPQIIARVNVTKNVYSASAVQRSANPIYGSANTHDPFYLPFEIKYTDGFGHVYHTKPFLTEEIGYKRTAAPGVHQAWFRLDGFYNFTQYPDYRSYNFTNYWNHTASAPTFGMTKNNFAIYAAGDYQLIHEGGRPSSGLYVGGVAAYAPPQQNLYSQYYEFRAYYPGVNKKRPMDMFTFTVDNYEFSKGAISNTQSFGYKQPLVSGYGGAAPLAGLTTSSASTSQLNVTSSYVVHASHGMWLNFALDWIDHPTPTPKTPNALVMQAGWAMFF